MTTKEYYHEIFSKVRPDNWVIRITTTLAGISIILLFILPSGSVCSNILISYIAGYFVYLLTTYIPSFIRSKPFVNKTFIEMRSVYNRLVSLLVLMYKNVCSEQHWQMLKISDDFDYFTSVYYEQMKQFNIMAEADSILMDPDTKKTISWLEKLELELNDCHSKIDNIILHCSPYLDSVCINGLIKIRDANLFEMILGKYGNIFPGLDGTDGYRYFDQIPVGMVLKHGDKGPFFGNEKDEILKDFVARLKAFREGLKSISMNDGSTVDILVAHNRYNQKNVGHFERAMYKR